MRVQSDHWTVILDFAEQHPEIITNRFNGPHGRQDLDKLWYELVLLLNGLGAGTKTVAEWKKSVIDWKSKTKAKAGAIGIHQNATGGGGPSDLSLTSFEERLLNIMGKTEVFGNSTVREIGFKKLKVSEEVPLNINENAEVAAVRDTSFSISDICSVPSKSIFLSIPQSQCKPLDRPVTFSVSTAPLKPLNNCPVNLEQLEECNITDTFGATLNNENLASSSTASNPKITNKTFLKTPTSKRKRPASSLSDQFQAMNDNVLEVLREINSNIANLSHHVGELVNILRNK